VIAGAFTPSVATTVFNLLNFFIASYSMGLIGSIWLFFYAITPQDDASKSASAGTKLS
jgi:hypothetical protein